MSLDQDLPQPNGPDTCISFHEMTTPKLPPPLTHCVLTRLSLSQHALSQSIARILDPGNSRENQLDFFSLDHEKWFSISRSRLETRDLKKEILVLVSKHEIERKNFSFSSRKTRFSFKFLNKSRCNILRKIKKLKVFFWKISVQAQATNQILVNSRENCLNLDSHSRLEVWDWR